MPAPKNHFKVALAEKRPQIGLWVDLADSVAAELLAGAGFDWLLIDGEHAPYDVRGILAQLQAVAAYPHCEAVVRVPIGETWIIKQVLDLGAQTILVPMVESAEQARQLVRATHYPPDGNRGVGASVARAGRFGHISDYISNANEEIALLVQVESRAGIAALDDILKVEGIAGVFIGPSDLAADLGYPGGALHPKVQEVVVDALKRIIASDKAAGILTSNRPLARSFIEMGATFVAVGADVTLLALAARQLAAEFKNPDGADDLQGGGY